MSLSSLKWTQAHAKIVFPSHSTYASKQLHPGPVLCVKNVRNGRNRWWVWKKTTRGKHWADYKDWMARVMQSLHPPKPQPYHRESGRRFCLTEFHIWRLLPSPSEHTLNKCLSVRIVFLHARELGSKHHQHKWKEFDIVMPIVEQASQWCKSIKHNDYVKCIFNCHLNKALIWYLSFVAVLLCMREARPLLWGEPWRIACRLVFASRFKLKQS